jgi:hypothetical protein
MAATVAKIIVDSSGLLLDLNSKTATFLLATIFKSAQEIHEIVKRTKANKRQCLRLSELS